MPSRSDWKNYTPGDIQGLSAFEKKDLFNNLERNYRALKGDRSAAGELPRIERILGFLGAKKDSAGNWSAPDFETAPTETGGDEVYKAARQMEADRRKKMEEEAALERARPADIMSFDALDVFGLTPAAKARENGPAAPMVFEEPLDVFGRMLSAPKSVETAETWKFDPIDVLGRKGFEGPAVEDMPGDETSGYSMSFPPLDIYGGKNPFKEGELEKEYNQKVKADADLLKNTTVGEMNPSDVGFRQWLAFQLNPSAAPIAQKRDEVVAKPSEFDFGDGLDLSNEELAVESTPVGRPQDYENPSQLDVPEELMGSMRQPMQGAPSRPPLLTSEGSEASDSALAGQEDRFKKWLQGQAKGPGNEGAHSADLRNEMQALIMAKGGMPYSPQTAMRQMAQGAANHALQRDMQKDAREESFRRWAQGRQEREDKREDTNKAREETQHRMYESQLNQIELALANEPMKVWTEAKALEEKAIPKGEAMEMAEKNSHERLKVLNARKKELSERIRKYDPAFRGSSPSGATATGAERPVGPGSRESEAPSDVSSSINETIKKVQSEEAKRKAAAAKARTIEGLPSGFKWKDGKPTNKKWADEFFEAKNLTDDINAQLDRTVSTYNDIKSKGLDYWANHRDELSAKLAELKSVSAGLQLTAKGDSLYKLGVIAGPDKEYLDSVIENPLGSPQAVLKDWANVTNYPAQVQSLRKTINDKLNIRANNMGIVPQEGSKSQAPKSSGGKVVLRKSDGSTKEVSKAIADELLKKYPTVWTQEK